MVDRLQDAQSTCPFVVALSVARVAYIAELIKVAIIFIATLHLAEMNVNPARGVVKKA